MICLIERSPKMRSGAADRDIPETLPETLVIRPPALTTATSLLPSEEDATRYQFLLLSRCVQLAPESTDV